MYLYFCRVCYIFLYVSANFQTHIRRFFCCLCSWKSLRLWMSSFFPKTICVLFLGNVIIRFTGMKNQNKTRALPPDNALEGTAMVRASCSLRTHRPPRRYFTPTTTSTSRIAVRFTRQSFFKIFFFIDYRRSTHTI